MNYAIANGANNHDNDFPVMTSDDVTDMVCKSVASTPASVERKTPMQIATTAVANYQRIEADMQALKAENARLQGELAAARDVIIAVRNLTTSDIPENADTEKWFWALNRKIYKITSEELDASK